MYLDKDATGGRGTDATLERPSVEEAVDGQLDPTIPTATVVIPLYAGKTVDDHVVMHWEGETAAGSMSDAITVTSANIGRVIRFYVENDVIAASDGKPVTVSYEVEHRAGGTDYSIELPLAIGDQVGPPGDIDPPRVEGVVDGVLNLETVPAGGAKAIVPPYDNMARFDMVFLSINDTEWEFAKPIGGDGDIGKEIEFTIPRDVLAQYSGQRIQLRARVIFAGGDVKDSADLPIRVLTAVGALDKVEVPLADGDSLDPEAVTTPTVEVRVKPYVGVAEGDTITFTWANNNGTPAPFTASVTVPVQPNQNYVFNVPRAQVDGNIDGSATLSYTVKRGDAAAKPSDALTLFITAPFEAAAELDLTARGYLVADKPPLIVPEYCAYTREAKFGRAPHTYSSSAPKVASVDANGRVLALDNGTAVVTATDSLNVSRSYTFTVRGIRRLYFVSASASYSGAQAACRAAGLNSATLTEIQQFWQVYYPSTGPVAGYLGWLGYPFWTGTQIGAGTAYAYDLNGASGQGNATGRNEADYLQVVGIAP